MQQDGNQLYKTDTHARLDIDITRLKREGVETYKLAKKNYTSVSIWMEDRRKKS